MAKLSARGRTELARVRKTCDKYKRTLALMSDGKVLSKLQAFMAATPYTPAHWHDYGWTVKAKIKDGVTVEQFVAAHVNERAGFVEVSR